jgi:predicted esterase
VSVAAAAALRPRGLFLLAPALTLPNLPSLMGSTLQCPTVISHGLHDDVVPFERSVEFARMHGHTLHLLNSDHRLQDALPLISRLFEFFLVAM